MSNATKHVSPKVSRDEMEATRVARFKNLKKFNVAFVDSLLPEHKKKNLKVIGRGVVEDPRMNPPIAADHGFTVAFITCDPQHRRGPAQPRDRRGLHAAQWQPDRLLGR